MLDQELIDLIQQTIDEEIERTWEERQPPEDLINRKTGQPPTPEEWETIKLRASEILSNPYAAPELVDWALQIAPDGLYTAYKSGFPHINRKMEGKG